MEFHKPDILEQEKQEIYKATIEAALSLPAVEVVSLWRRAMILSERAEESPGANRGRELIDQVSEAMWSLAKYDPEKAYVTYSILSGSPDRKERETVSLLIDLYAEVDLERAFTLWKHLVGDSEVAVRSEAYTALEEARTDPESRHRLMRRTGLTEEQLLELYSTYDSTERYGHDSSVSSDRKLQSILEPLSGKQSSTGD